MQSLHEAYLELLIELSKQLRWELIEDFHEGEEDGEEGKIICEIKN